MGKPKTGCEERWHRVAPLAPGGEGVPPCELCEEIEGVLLWRGKFAQGPGPVLGRLGGREILPIEEKKRWHSCTGGQKGDGEAKNGVRGEVARGSTFGTRRGGRATVRVVRGNRGGPLGGRKICAGGGAGYGKVGGKRNIPYRGEKEVAQLHRGPKRGWESQKRGARRGGTGWHLWHPEGRGVRG